MKSRTLSAVLAASLALAIAPVRATENHEYANDEYAIIRDGLAPNERVSLASHGEGEFGDGNFHVWLMAEPAHRRIAPLADIGSSNNLDTGPKAYHAFWSPDSRRVAIGFRSDRQIVELNLYRVEGRRAHLVLGPDLFHDVTSREPGRGDHMRRSVPEIEWRSPRHFRLKENRLFLTADPGFARRLGRFGRITDKLDDGRVSVEFSAEADCVMMPGNRYRIIDLRVGKFAEPDNW
jgi:hypothetical protein